MLSLLNYWLGLVGTVAIANGLVCFVNPDYPAETLYKPAVARSTATPLAARLFGVWTLLSGCLRLVSAFELENSSLFWITFLSFVLANLHFLSELTVYHTATLNKKVVAPLVVSTVSALWMLAYKLN